MTYVEATGKSDPVNVERLPDGRLRLHGIAPQPVTLPKEKARMLRDGLITVLGLKKKDEDLTDEDLTDDGIADQIIRSATDETRRMLAETKKRV